MKKYSFIALVVLTLMSSAACVRLNLLPPEDFSDSPWAVDKTLPVPIQFGQGDIFQIESKAGDSPISTANFNGKHFAVSAVPRDPGSTGNLNMHMYRATADDLLLNSAMAINNNGQIQFVDFDNGDEPINYYYPMYKNGVDPVNYTFVAYRTTTEDVAEPKLVDAGGGNLVRYIDFDLNPEDNNADVLWAASGDPATFTHGGHDYDGFNADYARMTRLYKAGGIVNPELNFVHCASCITIKVKAEDSDKLKQLTGDVRNFTIMNLRISHFYDRARLSLPSGLLQGRGSVTSSEFLIDSSLQTDIPSVLNPAVDSTVNSIGKLTNTPLVYGEFFMVPMVNDADIDLTAEGYTTGQIKVGSGVTLSFDLLGKNAEDHPITKSVDLPFPEYASSGYGAYLPGQKYTYTITVKNPEQIVITTSVANYTDFNASGGTYLGDPEIAI